MLKLFRLRALTGVSGASGYSRSTLYARIAQGLWTKPVKIGRAGRHGPRMKPRR
jgi:predicted DNA-binding transcriptional regulator AlpA